MSVTSIREVCCFYIVECWDLRLPLPNIEAYKLNVSL
jgi:hypothetical protein